MTALLLDNPWVQIRDGDKTGMGLALAHYSNTATVRKATGGRKRLFVGPGEKTVLLTADSSALFVWRKVKDGYHRDNQEGVNCALFHNGGHFRPTWFTSWDDLAARLGEPPIS